MTAPVTVALYHPIGILAFQRSRCQRTRVLRILDFSIHDARVSSIGYSEIMTSNETIPMYENTSKCRIPTPLDPLTCVLNVNGSDLVRKSWIAISCCTISLPSKISMPPNTDSLGSHATRPR
jgi:hypothetical protein